MKILAKFIDKNGVGLPEALAGDPLCTYSELLAREEHNCVWYTPEEIAVLSVQENKTTVLKALKAAK
jgi:hypothetical protein